MGYCFMLNVKKVWRFPNFYYLVNYPPPTIDTISNLSPSLSISLSHFFELIIKSFTSTTTVFCLYPRNSKVLESRALLSSTLEFLGYKQNTVVVEVNDLIINSKKWDSEILKEGDKLEIVSIVGGG